MLPHRLHESAALAAFARGKHVLLEKPMAPTPEACARILAAARKAGTVFMVGENAQYWPEVVRAQELLARGAIGDDRDGARVHLLPAARRLLRRPSRRGACAATRPAAASRSIRARTGCVRFTCGSASSTRWWRPSRARSRAWRASRSVRALLRFRSGVVASFDALLSEAPLAPELLFRITGNGRRDRDRRPRTLRPCTTPSTARVCPSASPAAICNRTQASCADFEAAVLDGKPLAAGPEASLGELRAALAMARSVESRGWEKV